MRKRLQVGLSLCVDRWDNSAAHQFAAPILWRILGSIAGSPHCGREANITIVTRGVTQSCQLQPGNVINTPTGHQSHQVSVSNQEQLKPGTSKNYRTGTEKTEKILKTKEN